MWLPAFEKFTIPHPWKHVKQKGIKTMHGRKNDIPTQKTLSNNTEDAEVNGMEEMMQPRISKASE